MPEMLAAIGYGGYISPIKLAVFLLLFFGGLPVVNWVHRDAEAMGTRTVFWTGMVFGAWAVAGIVWLLVPVFIIGTGLYLIGAGAAIGSTLLPQDTLVAQDESATLFTHTTVVTNNAARQTLRDVALAVANDRIVAIGDNGVRRAFADQLQAAGLELVNAIHSSANIAQNESQPH